MLAERWEAFVVDISAELCDLSMLGGRKTAQLELSMVLFVLLPANWADAISRLGWQDPWARQTLFHFCCLFSYRSAPCSASRDLRMLEASALERPVTPFNTRRAGEAWLSKAVSLTVAADRNDT